MTTGQRIAAKRKERELSQESLGAELGVSRQTVYKWESDTSLPEIEKLVALSRLFQVPVGWLLGVEEVPEATEFSEDQLKLLEELLGRYQRVEQAELSQGQRAQVEALVGERLSGSQRPRRRWPWALAALAVVWAGWSVFSRLDRMDGQYNSLANSVNNVSHSVNVQVGSIASRVEEILKAQNDLTADYATQLVSADLAENTVRFSLRAVPKTYTPGMSVVFLADSGGEVREMEAAEEENGAFTGEMVCPLTDSITLSAVFVTGNTRQTQLLDQYQGLYQDSFPQVEPMDLSSVMYSKRGKNGRFALPEGYITVGGERASVPVVNEALGVSRLREVRVGLFHNFKLVTWLEPCEKPDSFEGFAGQDFYRLDPMELDLAEGDDPLDPGVSGAGWGDPLAGGIGGLSEKHPGRLGPGVSPEVNAYWKNAAPLFGWRCIFYRRPPELWLVPAVSFGSAGPYTGLQSVGGRVAEWVSWWYARPNACAGCCAGCSV